MQEQRSSFHEVNIQEFFFRITKYWWLYLISLLVFGTLSWLVIKSSPPKYQIVTTLLLDKHGASQSLGESKLVEGRVGLVEPEKNIMNEINILRSKQLLKKTLGGLPFKVSYFTKDALTTREHRGNYPFSVEILDYKSQLVNQPIYIEVLSDLEFRINIEADHLRLSSFPDGKSNLFDDEISLSKIHLFGDTIGYPYLNVIVRNENKSFVTPLSREQHFCIINSLESQVRSHQSNLNIVLVDPQSSILQLSTTSEIVPMGIDFLNHLSRNYIQSKIEERNQIANKKEEFIRSQLAGIADSLRRAEYNFASFRRRKNAIDLSVIGSQALNDAQSLRAEFAKIDLNAKYYQSLLDYIQDSASFNKIIAPSVIGIEDPLLNDNLVDYKRLTAERSRLLYTKGLQSIDLKIVDSQIKDVKDALIENVRNLVESTRMRGNNVASRIKKVESTIKGLPGSERQLVGFERKSTLYENLYNYLSQELAKTRIARAEDLLNIKVLDEAAMSGSGPVSPKKRLIILLGLLCGLIFPTCYLYFKDHSAEPIHSANFLKSHSAIPVIAEIANDREIQSRSSKISNNWMTRESFRDLDANLKFLHPRQHKTVLSVTSMVPGEGKTFAALHLAQGMAAAKKRVLLVDVDFRKPSLSKILGNDTNHTLDNYLLERSDSYEALIQHHSDYPTLEYISTKAAISNPHRLIQNPRFEYLILTLKDDYDYVVLDCPAVGVVSDYLLFTHIVDIHLFVLRQGRSSIATIDKIQILKESGKLQHVYAVWNGASRRKTRRKYYGYDKLIDARVPHHDPELERTSIGTKMLPQTLRTIRKQA